MQRTQECETLLEQYQASTASDVTVDLTDVTFFDATGLGFLARLLHGSNARGGRVSLLYPSPTILRTLKLVAFDTALDIVADD